eukprot:jgi/Hompol1/6613/HPOL_000963-RA
MIVDNDRDDDRNDEFDEEVDELIIAQDADIAEDTDAAADKGNAQTGQPLNSLNITPIASAVHFADVNCLAATKDFVSNQPDVSQSSASQHFMLI